MSSLPSAVRERENDDEDLERDSKRPKMDDAGLEAAPPADEPDEKSEEIEEKPHILPPSHALLGVPLPLAQEGRAINFLETDVGISEYVGRGVSKIEGIIKQRCVPAQTIRSYPQCSLDLQISWFTK